MNENETDPRHGELAAEGAERGPSEQPTAAQPVHAGAAAQPAAPQWSAPGSAAPQSGVPQSGSPWQQPSPWQQGYRPAGYPAQPGYAAQPGYHHQQQYGQPGYGGWQQPGSTQAQPTIEGQAWQQPGAEGQAWGESQPAWAQPVDGQQQMPPRPPGNGRGRKVLVAGAAALLIALAGGGVGAAAVLALDHGSASPTVLTGNSSATRVVDRSSLAQIASAVQDSVVSIKTESGEGSGVILTADGYIVTNNHVVATAQGSTVSVIFADGKKADAQIVGTDERTDLAVVKTGESGLKAAKFGSSANMQVGDTVLAIGSPLGLEGSVTAGIISAKDRAIQAGDEGQQSPFGGQQQQSAVRTMTGLLQTDAPINPGNSGGALVNTAGEVIGINSAIATQGQGSGSIGLGFAIPSDKAKLVAQDLMAGKKVSHPQLGVSVEDAENGGALVRQVMANSGAAKAGLQQGDVIVSVNGKAIDDANGLIAAVQSGAVGQKMTIDFTRNGAKQQASVTLTETE